MNTLEQVKQLHNALEMLESKVKNLHSESLKSAQLIQLQAQKIVELTTALNEKSSKPNDAAVAAIKYALSSECLGSEREFLHAWSHGNFEAVRKEWEKVPEDVFIGADPLHPKTNIVESQIPTSIKEAVLVAIVESWDRHQPDIEKKFSVDELQACVDGTEHLIDSATVEDIYKKAFDDLRLDIKKSSVSLEHAA